MTIRHRVLTGITTSGTPHLGNYVGAIRPAIASSRRDDVESFFFLADYHALVKCQDPARVQRSTLEIAATWLALGLDPDRVFFYRQSDIPEIPELAWLLSCVAAKGLLNRAHAYKASVDANLVNELDADAGISMGLFSYPVLMAADILMFNAHRVPVGRDQVQHIEMARDFAQRFNHLYGGHFEGGPAPFVLPEAVVDASVATLPGLDGRKMSKSYDNTIPLWLEAKALRKALLGIVTDSRAPGEAKDPGTSNVFALYQAFASPEEADAMRAAFADGIGWGDAKQRLFERIDSELAPARERYRELMQRRDHVEEVLREGARKARARAMPFMQSLRIAVGLRSLTSSMEIPLAGMLDSKLSLSATVTLEGKLERASAFKTWRDSNGDFYFKLIDGDGVAILQSIPFDSAREASERIGEMKRNPASLITADREVTSKDGVPVGWLAPEYSLAHVLRALGRLAV